MRGCPTLVVGGWVLGLLLLGVADAQRTEALLRPRPSALPHIQLLPPVAAAEDGPREAPVRARTGAGSRGVWISAGGVCGDAGARAPIDQRAEEGHALDGVADAQAARIAEVAQETAERLGETIAAGVSGARGNSAQLLAAALL